VREVQRSKGMVTYVIGSTKSKKVLLTDDMIIRRSYERQFQKLIVDPIRSGTWSFLPMVIVVGAIDECDDG
jgi:hypothetical protein